ncbi:MAG: 4-(cytidine 5'-diphospho)-2-C-methyl-D-erythritol kinase [Lentisphaerae bacterium]|nr:4-(cytidine 5'-diphospho)-2-C-methyl-D-erythritol kinase [Lentisphaerota bacterium]
MKRLEVRAPAKINLYLDVLRKRADGYHNIKSLLLPLALYDQLVLEQGPGAIEVLTQNPTRFRGIPWPISMGSLENNLAGRAAHLLKTMTGYRRGARIFLKKNIPIAGGMGGGSADAAAVLVGLNRLWDTGLTQKELMAIGARLGCDIPALVHGGALEMNGRGERIRPLRLGRKRLWFLLINPGFGISTGDIYTRYTEDLTSPAPPARFASILRGLEEGSLELIAAGLFNALQKTVFQKYPLLKLMHKELAQLKAKGVLLSGTGPTLFALVSTRAQGYELAARVRAALGCPLWMRVIPAGAAAAEA